MSIYHLHIPRTGGVSIREHLINNLNDKFTGHRQELPNSFSEFKYVSGHFATNPIKDLDVNFAIVREPISLTFSYVNYMRQHFYPTFSFEEMMDFYLEKNMLSAFTNINIKFLTGHIDTHLYNQNIRDLKKMAENSWFVKDYKTNSIDALATVKVNKTQTIDITNPARHEFLCDLYNIHTPDTRINESYPVAPGILQKYSGIVRTLNELDLEFYGHLKK